MAEQQPEAAPVRTADPLDLRHIAEGLRGLAVPCDSLILDPANARRHPAKNLEAIRASLRVYGQRKPVVVNRTTGVVEAGNGTLAVARELGWSHVAAVFVDDDPMTAAGFAIADNRTAELAEWDKDALGAILREVEAGDADVQKMMDDLAKESGLVLGDADGAEEADTSPQLEGLEFRVVVKCEGEQDQATLIAELEERGYQCQPLMS